jgi:hypothetical protein
VRIRKKSAKPALSKPPFYLIGYSFSAPSADEVVIWYDLEYGGPLRLQSGSLPDTLLAMHGPWQSWLTIALPPDEAASLTDSVDWTHRNVGRVTPAPAGPALIADTVLFAARLARGLTLLTQGTALDLITQRYSNPSDWRDHPLVQFLLRDHLHVTQHDADHDGYEWFRTAGLSKFGLDELEMRQPQGLPHAFPIQVLEEAAEHALHGGHNLKVGTSVFLPILGRNITVVKHHTASSPQAHRIFRQVEPD